MKTWSVELEANAWNDDTFNGTFDECLEYCREHEYTVDGKEARLAEIEVDECNCVVNTYQIIEEL